MPSPRCLVVTVVSRNRKYNASTSRSYVILIGPPSRNNTRRLSRRRSPPARRRRSAEPALRSSDNVSESIPCMKGPAPSFGREARSQRASLVIWLGSRRELLCQHPQERTTFGDGGGSAPTPTWGANRCG